jgi:hypothetical protein
MEIPCVYRFDGPEMHVLLLEKLVDIPSNPAISKKMSPEKMERLEEVPKREKDQLAVERNQAVKPAKDK